MYLFHWIFVFFIGIYCIYLFYFIGCFTQLRQFLMYRHVNQPHVYTYPPFSGFPSCLGQHRAPRRVPCAVQWVLLSSLLYS